MHVSTKKVGANHFLLEKTRLELSITMALPILSWPGLLAVVLLYLLLMGLPGRVCRQCKTLKQCLGHTVSLLTAGPAHIAMCY